MRPQQTHTSPSLPPPRRGRTHTNPPTCTVMGMLGPLPPYPPTTDPPGAGSRPPRGVMRPMAGSSASGSMEGSSSSTVRGTASMAPLRSTQSTNASSRSCVCAGWGRGTSGGGGGTGLLDRVALRFVGGCGGDGSFRCEVGVGVCVCVGGEARSCQGGVADYHCLPASQP